MIPARWRTTGFFALVVAASMPSAAAAELAPAPDPDGGVFPDRVWYGWQVAAVDAAAWGLFALTDLAVIPLVAGTSVSPVVHALHGQGGGAAVSVALRVGGIVIGFLAGVGTAPDLCPEPDDAANCESVDRQLEVSVAHAWRGTAIGLGVAQAIDVLLVSWERRATDPGPWVAPWITPSAGGVTFGLGGTF